MAAHSPPRLRGRPKWHAQDQEEGGEAPSRRNIPQGPTCPNHPEGRAGGFYPAEDGREAQESKKPDEPDFREASSAGGGAQAHDGPTVAGPGAQPQAEDDARAAQGKWLRRLRRYVLFPATFYGFLWVADEGTTMAVRSLAKLQHAAVGGSLPGGAPPRRIADRAGPVSDLQKIQVTTPPTDAGTRLREQELDEGYVNPEAPAALVQLAEQLLLEEGEEGDEGEGEGGGGGTDDNTEDSKKDAKEDKNKKEEKKEDKDEAKEDDAEVNEAAEELDLLGRYIQRINCDQLYRPHQSAIIKTHCKTPEDTANMEDADMRQKCEHEWEAFNRLKLCNNFIMRNVPKHEMPRPAYRGMEDSMTAYLESTSVIPTNEVCPQGHLVDMGKKAIDAYNDIKQDYDKLAKMEKPDKRIAAWVKFMEQYDDKMIMTAGGFPKGRLTMMERQYPAEDTVLLAIAAKLFGETDEMLQEFTKLVCYRKVLPSTSAGALRKSMRGPSGKGLGGAVRKNAYGGNMMADATKSVLKGGKDTLQGNGQKESGGLYLRADPKQAALLLSAPPCMAVNPELKKGMINSVVMSGGLAKMTIENCAKCAQTLVDQMLLLSTNMKFYAPPQKLDIKKLTKKGIAIEKKRRCLAGEKKFCGRFHNTMEEMEALKWQVGDVAITIREGADAVTDNAVTKATEASKDLTQNLAEYDQTGVASKVVGKKEDSAFIEKGAQEEFRGAAFVEENEKLDVHLPAWMSGKRGDPEEELEEEEKKQEEGMDEVVRTTEQKADDAEAAVLDARADNRRGKAKDNPDICFPKGKTKVEIDDNDPDPIRTLVGCFELREENIEALRGKLKQQDCNKLLRECRYNELKNYKAYGDFVSKCLTPLKSGAEDLNLKEGNEDGDDASSFSSLTRTEMPRLQLPIAHAHDARAASAVSEFSADGAIVLSSTGGSTGSGPATRGAASAIEREEHKLEEGLQADNIAETIKKKCEEVPDLDAKSMCAARVESLKANKESLKNEAQEWEAAGGDGAELIGVEEQEKAKEAVQAQTMQAIDTEGAKKGGCLR